MASDPARFAERVIAAASPTGEQAAELLAAAAALAADPGAPQMARWLSALRAAVGQDPVGALLRAWGLPPVPGADAVAGPVVRRMLRGEAGAPSGGADLDLGLGPLRLSAGLPPLVLPASGRPAVVAALLPPTGAAARIDAGPVALEGGLLSVPGGWAGSLSAELGVVCAGAMALLNERGGTASFAAVLGARFTPGIQVGFGFEVSSVGGVVGVNVAADVDALTAALASGAAVSLFVPAAPGDAADRRARLALLPRVLPTRAGSVVAGPAADLTWLQIAGYSALRLSLVALLELPRGRLVLLGRAAVSIPPVLDLQLDVVGEIDPAAALMAVDLAVVSGRLFGLLRVDGTAAMRVRTCDPAAALLTLGGFYPGYRADVPGLPPQRRLSMGSDLPLPLTFRYEGYLALTDGTVQAGARVEIGFDAGLSVHGYLQFDAIGHYDPFHVHAGLSGGVDVGALGMDFAGVDFHGVIDGPGPVVVSGEVSVEFLGAEARWHDSFRIGPGGGSPATPPVANLVGLVVTGDEGAAPAGPLDVPGAAVVAHQATDPHVDAQPPPRDPDGLAVVPPLGSVSWSQTVAPFDTPMQRVRGRPLAAPARLSLHGLPPGAAVGPTEQFAPAALTDADREALLTLPAFERLPSGVTVDMPLTAVGAAVGAAAGYDEYYRGGGLPPGGPLPGQLHGIAAALIGALGARRAAAVAAPTDPAVAVAPERWVAIPARGAGAATTRTAAVLAASGPGAAAVPAGERAVSVEHLWEP